VVARWDDATGRSQHPVKITSRDDRTGMLKELTAVISDDNTNIRGVSARMRTRSCCGVCCRAEDLRHLNRMVLNPPRQRCVLCNGPKNSRKTIEFRSPAQFACMARFVPFIIALLIAIAVLHATEDVFLHAGYRIFLPRCVAPV
jgi:hypothetical protein